MVTPDVVAVVVDGEPVPKGRPRTSPAEWTVVDGRRVRTRAARTYTPTRTAAAEERIGWALRAAGVRRADTDDLEVRVVFHLAGRRRVDVDNLVKTALDACNGIAWRDDCQVTLLHAEVVRGSPRPRTELAVRRRVVSDPTAGRRGV